MRMKGDIRCFEGYLWRHDPQPDDPDLETKIGPCPGCYACEPSDEDEWCDTCQNLGIVDCHCGGDLCVCLNYGEKPCPDCDRGL